jgi:predicted KAP-like P-loop ATPase
METYISDNPQKDPKADLFRRWPFAKRIANTISNRTDSSSMVIGIYGNWGEGKTTVLNFIETELLQDNSNICVKFNPWLFSTEAQLILSFFNTLAKALDKSLPTRKEKIGKFLSKYGSLIAPLSVSPVPLFEFSPGKTLQELGKQLSSVELDELKERIQSILKAEKKRIVILMDDIDRLDKQEIYNIFKLVKLTADFEYTAYILAFDYHMVANALSERYSGNKTDAGASFLEKIIQVPLILPKADEISLRQLCFQGVDQAIKDAEIELTESQVQEFVRHFVDGLEIRLNTPRMAKRYTNALAFALPILKGEVNPVDLMLTEGIRVFYPQLYDFIRIHPEMFHGVITSGHNTEKEKEKIRNSINELLSLYSGDETAKARSLLETLFPKLKGVFGNYYYGSEWQKTWANEQRISSSDYFFRYFSYTIPEGDVPDLVIDQFLSQTSNLPHQDIAALLIEMITKRNADKILLKLRRKEKQLSETDSSNLSKALAISGSLFPDAKQMFSFTGAFSQSAILIHQLLLNILKGEKRLETAKEIIKIAEPLPFATEILRWLLSPEDKNEAERTFAKEDENTIGRIVAERISSIANENNIYLKFEDNSPSLFWVWSQWIGFKEVAEYLENTLDLLHKSFVAEFKVVNCRD